MSENRMERVVKPGTRIELHGTPALGVAPERATIMRWTKAMGDRSRLPAGFHPVRFDADGGKLMVHEGAFRVIDNR